MAKEAKTQTLISNVAEEKKAFERRFGQLMLIWSDVELALYELVIVYAGVKPEVGRAIFSGCRARQACDFINAISENIGIEKDRMNDFKVIQQQIASINTMRDRLAHHGSHSFTIHNKNNERILTDGRRSSRVSKVQRQWVGSKMIENMIADLKVIYKLLNHQRALFGHQFSPLYQTSPSWLYKSPQPTKPLGK